MKLRLRGIEVDCIIGDLPEERTHTQRLSVDVELAVPEGVADSDSLADAIDYAELTDRIRAALAAARCRMIERAAKVVHDVCMEDSRVRSARVIVSKSGSVKHLESAFAEYELGGIESIARGVAIRDGKLLLCRSKGGKATYLPGGHIEFGETGREALVREVREELGLSSSCGRFMGAVESRFMQNGMPHAEINLVYELHLGEGEVASREDWIEFVWWDLADLGSANLLPEVFRRLGDEPSAVFEV